MSTNSYIPKELLLERAASYPQTEPRVVPDRTVLAAEPRDELVCRALGAVLNQKQPSSSSKYFQE